MRLRTIILITVFLCPSAVYGQAAVSAGAAFPIAPETFEEAYNPGFSMSGSFRLPLPETLIIPRLSAGFSNLRFDDEGPASDELEPADLSAIFIGFDAQLIRPYGMIKPYVAPFLGFAIVSAEGFSGGETGFTIGGAIGTAVRIPPGPHLFVEARLLHAYIEGGNLTWVPVHAGIAFDLE